MSALSYLCGYGYGSNSEDSDGELDKTIIKSKLPPPDLSKVPVVPGEIHIDNPELHGRRTRCFQHERGNWATFVYIKYPENEELLKLVEKLQTLACGVDESCKKSEDLHISLSKTVVLKYHHITPFTSSLQTALDGIERFDLAFDSIKIYCNEDNTRTFIALTADYLSQKSLLVITKKVNEILEDYKLPTFYDDPSFHISILWINGDKRKELTCICEVINNAVTEYTRNLKSITITTAHCRIGNKKFQYTLA